MVRKKPLGLWIVLILWWMAMGGKMVSDVVVFAGINDVGEWVLVEPNHDVGTGDIIKALELSLKHITAGDMITSVTAVYVTPQQRLREAADEMDRKEADIAFIKKVLAELIRNR